MRISIIIPALNEAQHIGTTLSCLEPLRQKGHEVIVVDGGSQDATLKLASSGTDKVVTTMPGRARQMNAGAEASAGDVLWFLHADTRVPEDAADKISLALANPNSYWGRFDIRLSGEHYLLRIVEKLMNLRSCISGIATGDQGIFVRRACFEAIGGFQEIPLMEDIELSKRLKKWSRPCCIHRKLVTSSRRWEKHGVVRTIILMWRLRLAYAMGVSPDKLAPLYKFSD